MLFQKNRKFAKNSLKKIDTVVTGIILGWVIASIYGINKKRGAEEAKVKKNAIVRFIDRFALIFKKK